MRPRLRVLLGGGGVGKTTLAASLAIALARKGRNVGLLGIDPARRLRSALGLRELGDLPDEVPGENGRLHAAVLRPEQTLRRWASESRANSGGAAQLFDNPFFALLADGLAASTDALAAGRLVEWSEREPLIDELIVDTAPGLPALEFLSKPDKLLALLDGHLLRWLGGRGGHDVEHAHSWSLPRFVGGGLARVAGLGAFAQVGDMISQMEECLATFGRRLGDARDWFGDESTQLLIVGSAERTSDCAQLSGALARLGLAPARMILNRALPESLASVQVPAGGAADERAFLAWLRALAQRQQQALHELSKCAVPIAVVPRTSFDSRSEALAQLGAVLLAQVD